MSRLVTAGLIFAYLHPASGNVCVRKLEEAQRSASKVSRAFRENKEKLYLLLVEAQQYTSQPIEQGPAKITQKQYPNIFNTYSGLKTSTKKAINIEAFATLVQAASELGVFCQEIRLSGSARTKFLTRSQVQDVFNDPNRVSALAETAARRELSVLANSEFASFLNLASRRIDLRDRLLDLAGREIDLKSSFSSFYEETHRKTLNGIPPSQGRLDFIRTSVQLKWQGKVWIFDENHGTNDFDLFDEIFSEILVNLSDGLRKTTTWTLVRELAETLSQEYDSRICAYLTNLFGGFSAIPSAPPSIHGETAIAGIIVDEEAVRVTKNIVYRLRIPEVGNMTTYAMIDTSREHLLYFDMREPTERVTVRDATLSTSAFEDHAIDTL